MRPGIPLAALGLLLALASIAACNPRGTPTPGAPAPSSATTTPTLPPPQFPDTPTPPETDTPTLTPSPSPTATKPPTVSPTPLAGDYQLNLIYNWSASNSNFKYTESVTAAAQFTVAKDNSIAGSGSGTYTQGLGSSNPNFNCGFPLNLPIKLAVTGAAGPSKFSPAQVLHLKVALQFSGTATADVYCEAAGMKIGISPVAPVDVLTQRAADFPWADFEINTVLGLYSAKVSSAGIDWKPVGNGDVTIRVKSLK